jgi:hypothetical protein
MSEFPPSVVPPGNDANDTQVILRHPDIGEVRTTLANGQLRNNNPQRFQASEIGQLHPEQRLHPAQKRLEAAEDAGELATEEVVQYLDTGLDYIKDKYPEGAEVGILLSNGDVDSGWKISRAERKRSGDVYVWVTVDGVAMRSVPESRIVLEENDSPEDGEEETLNPEVATPSVSSVFEDGDPVWVLDKPTGNYSLKKVEKSFSGKHAKVWIRVIDPKNPEWTPRRIEENELESWQDAGEEQAEEAADKAIGENEKEYLWSQVPEFSKGMKVRAQENGEISDHYVVDDCGTLNTHPGIIFMRVKNTETGELVDVPYDVLKHWQTHDISREPDEFGNKFHQGDHVKLVVDGAPQDDWRVISSSERRTFKKGADGKLDRDADGNLVAENEIIVRVMRAGGDSKILEVPQSRLLEWQNSLLAGGYDSAEVKKKSIIELEEPKKGFLSRKIKGELDMSYLFAPKTPDGLDRRSIGEEQLRSALDEFIASGPERSRREWEEFCQTRAMKIMTGLTTPVWAVAEKPTKLAYNTVGKSLIMKPANKIKGRLGKFMDNGKEPKGKLNNFMNNVKEPGDPISRSEQLKTYGLSYDLTHEELQYLMAEALERHPNGGDFVRSEFNRLKKEYVRIGLTKAELEALREQAELEFPGYKESGKRDTRLQELIKQTRAEKRGDPGYLTMVEMHRLRKEAHETLKKELKEQDPTASDRDIERKIDPKKEKALLDQLVKKAQQEKRNLPNRDLDAIRRRYARRVIGVTAMVALFLPP